MTNDLYNHNPIKLSFCIPTYNRADYLKQTLDNIISQCDDSVEIVVSDNASTDNTSEIINSAKKVFPNIRYFKWEENQGADKNYLKTVELAKGDYCWFFGSDDALKVNAVERILSELKHQLDIYLCSEYLCDISLKPYSVHFLLAKEINDSEYDFSNHEELLQYFKLAQSHSALFGYLSCIIFKRDKWNSIQYNEKYTGTLYSHMYMLYSFIQKGCKLKYIKEPLVYWRSGNDSFGGAGNIPKRYLIDIDGFTMIIKDFFNQSEEISAAFKGAFRRHHPYKNLAYLRINTIEKLEWISIENKLVNDFNYSRSLLYIMRSSLAKYGLKVLFKVYRIQMKIRRKFININ